jgi:hypothetical protein
MAKLRAPDGLAELRTAVWILHGSIDPLQTLAGAHLVPGANRFSLKIHARRAPIEALFHFRASSIRDRELCFTWTHDGDALLPSMSGTIAARRFGPLVIVSMRARYACGYEVPERLFFEAIGRKLAHRTFTALRRAVLHLLQHLPSRSIYELSG